MKKLITLLVSAILILAGCSSGTAEGDGKLTIWAWDPNFNIPVMETAAKYYQVEHPDVEIEVVDMAQEDVVQKLNTQLSAGDTSSLPDIVLIEDYKAQMFLTSYPDAFYPLTDVVPYEDFAQYKVEAVSYNGESYGVPFDTGVTGLYYRTDYLANAGYTEEDMQDLTWEEYFAIGEDVVAANPGVYWTGTDPADLGTLRVIMQAEDVWYFDEKGTEITSLVENDVLIEAMGVAKELVTNPINATHNDWASGVAGVNSGSYATVVNGCWYTPTVMAQADQSGKWAIAPIPSLGEDGGHYSSLGGSSWYVPKGTGDEELAADFLTTVFTDVAFYEEILVNYGAIGTYLPASESPAYQAPVEFFGGQAIYADFSEWSSQVPTVNYGTNNEAANQAIIGEIPYYYDGTKTAEETLQAATETLVNQGELEQ